MEHTTSAPHRAPSGAATGLDLLPFAAGALWASQALVWTLAPKVQAPEPPYGVVDRPLFAVVWLAIVAAVACSAAAVLGLLRRRRTLDRRVSGPARASALAARAVLLVSGVAGVAVVVAALGVAEDLGLAVLSPALNLAGLLLLGALCLAAVALRGSGVLPGRWAALPTVLSVLTLLTLGAIVASGSGATVGLVLAVVVVTLHGGTWVLLGATLRRP